MFTARGRRRNLDPYFRSVYFLQIVAAGAMLAGLFLVWWGSSRGSGLTAFNILDRSTVRLRSRSPTFIFQPLFVLWFILPVLGISLLRGITGLLVVPVWYRRIALITWGAAMLALGHFFINYGHALDPNAPLKDGSIQPGFWLTGSSCLILGLLILVEWTIRTSSDPWAEALPADGPVDDAEQLWRGEYVTCPHCGMLNSPKARACYNCHNVLFNFRGDE